jgi:NADH-quinone oxidoreductase subunit J
MNLLFLLFSVASVVGSLFVVLSANPVHSVLSLILVFCFTSMTLILLTADFIGLLLIVVYVGAIAVLFLFVIMMLNIKLVQLTESTVRWLPIIFFLIISLVAEVFYSLKSGDITYAEHSFLPANWYLHLSGKETLGLLGEFLYSYTFYHFLLAGGILLTALVGAITVTVGLKRVTRRQYIYKQVGRDAFGAINFYK